MGTLFSILGTGAQSLGAQRNVANTASNNMQNVNTPGYARQRANLLEAMAVVEGGVRQGTGATVDQVTQLRDPFAEMRMSAALAQDSFGQAATTALQNVPGLDPLAQGGVGDALGAFFEAMTQWSQNAGNPGYRQAMLGATAQLTTAFNQTASGLGQARAALDAVLSGNVATANSAAQKIANLNVQIKVASASGTTPNELLDARQNAVDQLAGLTGARAVPDGNGGVSMVLATGQALVTDAGAATLSTLADPSNNGLVKIQLSHPLGGGTVTLAPSQLGGAMGGSLAARDGALKTAVDSLDGLAFDLAGALNTVHRAGAGLDGVGGRDLLDAGATAAGAAGRISVSSMVAGNPSALAGATAASGLPGGSDNVLALLGVRDQSLVGSGQTAAGTWGALLSTYGTTTNTLQSQAQSAGNALSMIQALRESASGVSIDEEMVALTAAQRAFEANLKVISTADEMLTTLFAIKP